MDVTSNRPGLDYRGEIKRATENCQAVLAVIGRRWIGGGRGGHTRITDPNDPVRTELELALQRAKLVIPVLVGGARMPAADKLPDSLKKLTFIHAAEVDPGQDFDFHIQRLIAQIDGLGVLTGNIPAPASPEPPEQSVVTREAPPALVPPPTVADEAPSASSVDAEPVVVVSEAAIDDTPPPPPLPSRRWRLGVTAVLATVVCAVGIRSWIVTRSPRPAPKPEPVAHTIPPAKLPAGSGAIVTAMPALASKPKTPTKGIGGLNAPLTLSPSLSGSKPLRAVAFSPDHHILAVGGDDGVIRLWDSNTLQLIRRMPARGRTGDVRRLAFNDDGSKLIAAGFENAIRVWDVASGEVSLTLSDSEEGSNLKFYSLAVHAGRELGYITAGDADGKIRIWDVQKSLDKPVAKKAAHKGQVYALHYSPAISDYYASAGRDGNVNIYTSGHHPTIVIPTGQNVVFYFQYYLHGDEIITGGTDRTLKLWRISDKKLITNFEKDGHIKAVLCGDISRDGRLLLSGADDDTIKLWDIATGRMIRTFHGHKKDVELVAFHPNGKWFVSVSEDGTLKVWDISGKELVSIAVFDDGRYVAYTPTGRYTGTADVGQQFKITYREGAVERSVKDDDSKRLFVAPDRFASVAGLN